MDVSERSVAIARSKKNNDEGLRLCLTYLVCPTCSKKLETKAFPEYKYFCEHCDFKFTGEQESELAIRESKSC